MAEVGCVTVIVKMDEEAYHERAARRWPETEAEGFPTSSPGIFRRHLPYYHTSVVVLLSRYFFGANKP
jgi:hypothetical protein